MQRDTHSSPTTIHDLTHCWAGECRTHLMPTFSSWIPGFPVIHPELLPDKQISVATAKNILVRGGYRSVTDPILETTVKFLGGGAVLWLDKVEGPTLWAPRATIQFAETHPVILGFPPLPGDTPDLTVNVMSLPHELPPANFGTLALRVGGVVRELGELSVKAQELQGVLRGLIEHVERSVHQQQEAIESELWALFLSYHCQLIAQYTHDVIQRPPPGEMLVPQQKNRPRQRKRYHHHG